jgi:DNA modification methylase
MAKRQRQKKHTQKLPRTHAPPDLQIVWVPIGELKPAAYNPRTHSEEQECQLTESITRFSIVEPIVVNGAPKRKNIVIGGHFRLSVLKKLGYATVPVVYVYITSPERERELNLRLNRNVGEWDWSILKEFDTDFLKDVGFDAGELAQFWDGTLDTEDDHFDVEKELEEIGKPKAKRGDRYQLGPHILLCGDATNVEDVKRLAQKVRIDMVYCDPPYNIDLSYDKGISNKMRYGGQTKDNKTEEDYRAFLKIALVNALSVSKPDTHVFCWCDQKFIGLLQSLFPALGVDFRRVCLWIKNNQNMTPQVAFNKCYEPCVYGVRGKPYLSPQLQNLNEVANKEVGTGNRLIDDVVDLLDLWLCKRLPSAEYEHATAKPPTLHEKAIRRCTKPGDAILDLFGGSGSTLVAAHQMKRRAFLCEIEPVFVDLIIRRFEVLTGLKASLLKP